MAANSTQGLGYALAAGLAWELGRKRYMAGGSCFWRVGSGEMVRISNFGGLLAGAVAVLRAGAEAVGVTGYGRDRESTSGPA